MADMADVSILDICDLKMTPEDISQRADASIIKCIKMLEAIAKVPDDEVGFETILKPLNDVERIYNDARFSTGFIEKISSDSQQREASMRSCSEMERFWFDHNVYSNIFKKVKILDEKKVNLTGEYKYYLEILLEYGKKYGLHLSEDLQLKVRTLRKKIDEKCLQLEKNLEDALTILEFTDKDLDGLSEDFISSLAVKETNGKKVFTVKSRHYFPIMRKCRNPDTRKAMTMAFESECLKENTTILEEIISLRHEVALLLGYANNASLVASEMMLKTPENAKKFLMDLYEKCKPVWAEEKKQLLDMKEKECKELNIPFDGVLNQWDLDYYTEKTKVKRFLDTDKLKEYFPLDTVTKGMFKIYEKIFGLVFNEIEDPKRWRPDVRLFSVENASDGELLGCFYLDLFSSVGNFGQITTDMIQNTWLTEDETRQLPIAVIVACFPAQTPDKPVFLHHNGDDASVVNYFSKFGRMIHSICAKNELARFIAYDMPCDYSETPSKIFENMCWAGQQLRLMSAHYLTGHFLSDDILINLSSARTAILGGNCIREIIISLLDLEIHSQGTVDIKALLYNFQQEMLGFPAPEGTTLGAIFSHVCDYNATYFSHLWSEVVGCDIFENVFKGNMNESEVGKRFRKIVLEPAGSKDMSDTIREFLGRDPTPDEFLRTMAFSA